MTCISFPNVGIIVLHLVNCNCASGQTQAIQLWANILQLRITLNNIPVWIAIYPMQCMATNRARLNFVRFRSLFVSKMTNFKILCSLFAVLGPQGCKKGFHLVKQHTDQFFPITYQKLNNHRKLWLTFSSGSPVGKFIKLNELIDRNENIDFQK